MRRYKPQVLLAYEALLRNVDPSYRGMEQILSAYYKQRAGFYGEQQLDYKLSLLPASFTRLSDIRLENAITAFQMDAIVITSNVIIIAESKYLNGHIEYRGDVRQLVQINEGEIKSYKDPILQAKIQQRHLQNWLLERGYNIPIEVIAVSTNEYATIECIGESEGFLRSFITLENVPFTIEKLYSGYNKELLTPVEIQKLAHVLRQENRPKFVNVLQKLQVSKQNLILGIRCTMCKATLKRTYGTWQCVGCHHKDKHAHKQKIYDYFLLIGDTITNEQCRVWLGLGKDHTSTVSRMLRNMKLHYTGNTKSRKYHRPNIQNFPQKTHTRTQ